MRVWRTSGYRERMPLRGHPLVSRGHQLTSPKPESGGFNRAGQIPALSLAFLGEVLLGSSMFSDLHCKGCHPKAACPS